MSTSVVFFLYVLSPQVLWQAKTSLVETTLAFVILAMLYLLTDKKHEEYRWLFCIPVVVFAFLHITIYVFMPLFVLMAYGLYFKTGRKSYIAGAVVSTYTSDFSFAGTCVCAKQSLGPLLCHRLTLQK